MARSKQTKDLLTGKQKPQGWRDHLPAAQQSEAESENIAKTNTRFKRKTYLMTDELIERIEAQAEKAGVGINEMNRYLLTLALDLIEGGEHEIEVQTVNKRTLGV